MNAGNEDKAAPLHNAACFGKIGVIQFRQCQFYILLKVICRYLLIHLGHEKVAEVLLRNGANVNIGDDDQSTPLHYAAQYGQFKTLLNL